MYLMVVGLGLDWTKVVTAYYMMTRQIDASGCDAEVSHMICCRAAYTAQQATCFIT